MALHASSKMENVKSSIEKYIFTHLASNDSMLVDWQGGRPLDKTNINEWLQPTIMRGGQMYARHVSGSTKGSDNEILVNINIFLRKDSADNTHRLFEMRDSVAEHFQEDQQIEIRNYSGDSSFVDSAILREVITDQEIPTGDEKFYQYNYTAVFRLIQQW